MVLGDVTPYLPLVRSVASRMAARLPRTVDLDDLISAGVLGLINAARQYDEDRGVPFDRYAEIRVRGAIVDELRTLDQTTRSARKRLSEIADATRFLATQLGRQPSQEEVALALGVSLSQFHAMTSRASPVLVFGFDDLGGSGQEGRQDSNPFLQDHATMSPESAVARRETAEQVARAVEDLTDRQRQVITFYYFEGMNYREIANLLGVTEGRVSQLHTAATERLKTLLDADLGA